MCWRPLPLCARMSGEIWHVDYIQLYHHKLKDLQVCLNSTMNCVASLFYQRVLICVLDSLVPKMKENIASLFHLINSVPRNLVFFQTSLHIRPVCKDFAGSLFLILILNEIEFIIHPLGQPARIIATPLILEYFPWCILRSHKSSKLLVLFIFMVSLMVSFTHSYILLTAPPQVDFLNTETQTFWRT